MEYAIILALMAGRPTVLEYHGNLSLPFDPSFSQPISFEEAKRRILNERRPSVVGRTPLLVACPNSAVYKASDTDALFLLDQWIEAKGDRQQMKAALSRLNDQSRRRVKERLLIP
jgi:hypothetical protein